MVSMTFCRAVLFDEKKEDPDQVGEDNAIGGVAGCSPQRGWRATQCESGGDFPRMGIIFYLYAHESFFI